MNKAYIIIAKVKYSTEMLGELEYLVIAKNSKAAIDVLLHSAEFPRVGVISLDVGNYHGEMVIDRNEVRTK